MADDISNNSPLKETFVTLAGTALFLAIVLLIAISAWLRPAGNHVVVKPKVDSTATNPKAEAKAASPDAAPAEQKTESKADAKIDENSKSDDKAADNKTEEKAADAANSTDKKAESK